ncbi:MAG: HlyD family efflux transporter periplasmic adaptor subunit [Acidobacteria bacterium]|nr:HlyD family efflux transporter periplasmic adaptor subunit [Acidobacteriota bacterium]
MSKDLKPKQRLGQAGQKRWRKIAMWVVLLGLMCGGAYAAYRYTGKTVIEIPTARARTGEFVISVKTRGEVRSTNSMLLAAPQVPDPKITYLAESGKPVQKGQKVIEFDTAQQEQYLLDRSTSVKTVDSEIVQIQATHRITNEMDAMQLMTYTYNVERAKLEASKASVISEIEGEKAKIDVGVAEGQLGLQNTTIGAHKVTQSADIDRLNQKKDKTVRDMNRAKGYLDKMAIYAPISGIINILPNFRTQGSFGSSPPPFKEGDRAWTGAVIAEIPDLSSMRVELKLDEVDRGKLQIGQSVRVRVDAIPEKELMAELDWISPIAAIQFRGPGMSDKTFPARATLKNLDSRLRPGMSSSAEVLIESQANALMIPARASFVNRGKPSVWVQRGTGYEVREIEVGKRNENDLVVTKGLKNGETVYLENPVEAARKAKKI